MKCISYIGYIFLMSAVFSLGGCSYKAQPPAPPVEVNGLFYLALYFLNYCNAHMV